MCGLRKKETFPKNKLDVFNIVSKPL